MTAPDPAERRHVIRGAIECAIGVSTTTRRGQTGSLTAAVWRIVEPALAHRDRQIAAVRDVLNAMDGTTGARFWAQQLHAALSTRPGTAPPIAWCGASMPGFGAEPIGPCVLRADHDGPVHQAANGAKWWPTDGGVVTAPESMTEQEVQAFRQAWAARQSQSISVINRTPPRRISAPLFDDADPPINLGPLLDAHPWGAITTDSIDPAATHPAPPDGAAIYETLVRLYRGLFPPDDVPPALQGPGWQPLPGAPELLREVAAQALAEEQPPAADAEYDALKAAYREAVTTGAHRVTVLEPDPVTDARAVVQSVTRPQLHDAIRTLARMDRPWWDGELRRMARLEGHTSLLGGHR